MYYPILRGKQNELLALRELAKENIINNFIPIIEPVKKNLSALIKAIEELNKKGIEPIVIINPDKGDYKTDRQILTESIKNKSGVLSFLPCVIYQDSRSHTIISKLTRFSIISDGVSDELVKHSHIAEKTMVRPDVSPSILSKMRNVVLYDDFFQSQIKNADYPLESKFTGLHTYYTNSPNVLGFGDYTITGANFSEKGGPAYVVAIHVSYIDNTRYQEKYIRHYLSFNDKTPEKSPDKFKHALACLIDDLDNKRYTFINTNALADFISLNKRQHFPGLGQVKKISIKHHIETFNHYLNYK